MKKKALVLAVCMAIATPTISVAKALPNDFLGISLGEIQPKSFLNEPFNGIIPILFTDIETSKTLKVKLASEAVFQKIGAEKLPILSTLKFQIKVRNKKPVVIIKSTQAINVPFLNFVLEIESSKGSIFQDYTTLLDPKNKTINKFSRNEELIVATFDNNLSPFSTSAIINTNLTHIVKSGDTLSEIAKALSHAEISLKKMITAIHHKNPNAFIRNNINRLKAGAILQIPSQYELKSTTFKAIAKSVLEKKQSVTDVHSQKLDTLPDDAYIIKKGDTLSAITKKHGHKNISFTKMMKAIHTANPHAFSRNKINILKVGKILKIPSFAEVSPKKTEQASPNSNTAEFVDPNLIILEDSVITDNPSEFKLDGFIVEKGDTLSSVAKQIGHTNVSHTKMMKAIYIANPEAFEKNNITMLKEGAIIRLPSIVEVEELNIDTATPSTSSDNKKIEGTTPSKIEKDSNNIKNKGNLVLTNLEKRIRELKRNLEKSNSHFSKLEQTLITKEVLIKKQSKSLQELASSLSILKNEQVTTASTESPNFSKENNKLSKEQANDHLEKTLISFVRNPNKSIKDKESPKTTDTLPLSIEEELLAAKVSKSYIPTNLDQELTSTLKSILVDYGIYMSGKGLLSTILALLLGLFLIRYRREIYSYTNISYEHPKYYPPLDENKAREVLKEKAITFHDTIIDTHKSPPHFSGSQIEECEELVEELIDDLKIKSSTNNGHTDWEHLNKACDDYIAEFKNEKTIEISDPDDNHSLETTQPEEMTFELFESLAEGVVAKESSSNIDKSDEDTIIYGLENNITTTSQEHINSIPPIFDDLVKLSEDAEVEKMFMKQ